MTNLNKKNAFSLIELAVVILVIGLLIGGIAIGKNMVSLAYLTNARMLTAKSPVSDTDNLVLWLEATLKDSLDQAERIDGNLVSQWNDINSQSFYTHNATQSGSSKPTYTENAVNNLPAILFDGDDDNLNLDSDLVFSGGFTMFFVVTTDAVGGINMFLTHSTSNTKIGLFSGGKFFFRCINGGTGENSTVDWIFEKSPTIITLTRDSSNKVDVSFNGGSDTRLFADVAQVGDSEWSIVGNNSSNDQEWNGNIGEIVTYDRYLSTLEREEIEEYLSKKWKIDLN